MEVDVEVGAVAEVLREEEEASGIEVDVEAVGVRPEEAASLVEAEGEEVIPISHVQEFLEDVVRNGAVRRSGTGYVFA